MGKLIKWKGFYSTQTRFSFDCQRFDWLKVEWTTVIHSQPNHGAVVPGLNVNGLLSKWVINRCRASRGFVSRFLLTPNGCHVLSFFGFPSSGWQPLHASSLLQWHVDLLQGFPDVKTAFHPTGLSRIDVSQPLSSWIDRSDISWSAERETMWNKQPSVDEIGVQKEARRKQPWHLVMSWDEVLRYHSSISSSRSSRVSFGSCF